MDFIRPIGPIDRDVDPIQRVERSKDEREEREQQSRERKERQQQPPQPPPETGAEGPVEGDDGHLHIDIRA